jgi:hypothetical protein
MEQNSRNLVSESDRKTRNNINNIFLFEFPLKVMGLETNRIYMQRKTKLWAIEDAYCCIGIG